MSNIFFVNSPFQLLCSIEAVYKFNTVNNVLVVFNKGKGETLNQIETLLKDYESKFSNIEFIDRELESVSGWIEGLRCFDDLVKKYSQVNKVFIGDYRNGLLRHFTNSIKYSEIILLDDGFATINIHRQIQQDSLYNYKDYVKYILSKGKYRFKAKAEVSFFSIFQNYLDSEKVYANKFGNLISNDEWIDSDSVFWLGSPIVESGIVDKEFYFNKIEDIFQLIGKSKKIIYFPHRSEESKKLQELTDRFEIEVKYIDFPIEQYVIQEKIRPKAVISFYSTALYSLSRILTSTNVCYIPIPKKYLLKRSKEIGEVYAILEKEINDIRTIEL